jgi:hypothetical protein
MLTGIMEGKGLVLQTGAGGLAQWAPIITSKLIRRILFIKLKYDLKYLK